VIGTSRDKAIRAMRKDEELTGKIHRRLKRQWEPEE